MQRWKRRTVRWEHNDQRVSVLLGRESLYQSNIKYASFSQRDHYVSELRKKKTKRKLIAIIFRRKSNPVIENELIGRCKAEDLILISVGPLPTEQNTSEALFQILFIVAIVAVLALFILVVVLYISNSE